MDFFTIGQKIDSKVKSAQNILLVSHQQPDADALGSIVAISKWLDFLNKEYTKFCLDQASADITWLTNFEPLASDPDYLIKQDYDLVIVLDSGDLKHAGIDEILPKLSTKPFIINIDHHATNQNFGDINLVDPTAVSTTEIIYQIFKILKIKISRPIASALLSGIIYDTYNFTNPNTTQQSLKIASKLLIAGASLPQVSDSILKNKSVESLKIWGEILTHLNHNSNFGMVSTAVVPKDFNIDLLDSNSKQNSEFVDGISNFLNNLTGVKAALILQQQEDNIIKGSLRTNDDLIDVSKLAKILGGGGHRKAAGFKVKGKLVKSDTGDWKIV